MSNGDVVQWFAQENRVLKLEQGSGSFVDAAESLGFDFQGTPDLTEYIECGDLSLQTEGTDVVLIGNTGSRNLLYVRRY